MKEDKRRAMGSTCAVNERQEKSSGQHMCCEWDSGLKRLLGNPSALQPALGANHAMYMDGFLCCKAFDYAV